MRPVYATLGPEGFGAYQVDFTGSEPRFERVSTAASRVLAPGFVDLHIHGGFGIDAMSATPEQFDFLCSKLETCGYEGFLATSVTAPATDLAAMLTRLPSDPMILGVHLEGPFINPKHPGAQPPHAIVTPPTGPSAFDAVLNDPRVRIVTLAPETPGAPELISRLRGRGVLLSMGHTDATYEQARRGHELGASHVTHAFNAMRNFHHREPGIVGYLLGADDLNCELIYDRLHVSPEAAALLVKRRPIDRLIAVSDGTAAAGLPQGTQLEMWGQPCVVGRGDVRLRDGTLAGSAITLHDAFRNLAEDFGLEVAIRACCVNPRRALGMQATGSVYVEMNTRLEILQVLRVGEK